MSANTPMDVDDIVLFAKQKTIYPRRVWGLYRKVKWAAMILLLGIYYLAPWLRWDRGPNAPDQAILIDMGDRKAYFFFIEIWPQEVFYLAGVLMLAAFGLFFATSLAGRVWCGYACPQTVWTDLFVWVERLIQGDRNARMKLSEGPLTFEKAWKKSATHLVWIIIGLFTGGAWVFYFNDAPTLFDQIIHFDVPWGVLSWILALTGSTYLMAGFAREQVCTYMCPYSRFQSAMFDKDTLIITYDETRGEPRGKHKAGETWDGRGDCIDCDSCVVVCPAGIDIRQGLQYQCISCGHCVDACNNVMDKVGRPRGLIRYDTERRLDAVRRGETPPAYKLLRPRNILYTVVITVVSAVMLYALLNRETTHLEVLQDRNPPFVLLSDGQVRNRYTLTILNKTRADRTFDVAVSGLPGLKAQFDLAGVDVSSGVPVLGDNVGKVRMLLTAPKPAERRVPLTITITTRDGTDSDSAETVFVSAQE
jgi:cytochrome c oxidase accessory protein FixG